jgi:periplasmic mercuric ion binding protein
MSNLVKQFAVAVCALTFAALTTAARAESTANLTKVHLCCKGCVTALEKSVAKMPDVKCEATEKKGTVVLTAPDDKTLQKAVDAIAKAGFHGRIDNKAVKFTPVKVPEGKVQRLELTGAHNCCPACTKAIKSALAKVEGVKGDNLKPKAKAFVIEGDFVAKDAIKAIENAGFYASPPKPKEEAASAAKS